MKSRTGWILAIILIVVLILAVPTMFMMGGLWGFGGMMGGRGMMGGIYGTMHPFGWVGMLFGGLLTIGILVLLVLGGVWVFNSLTRSSNPPSATITGRNCPVCGKPAQADWKTCPYCGSALQ